MRNIKITIEYEGTNYAGWQTQNRKPQTARLPMPKPGGQANRKPKTVSRKPNTIQQTIEKALAQILQAPVKLIGSGRTDSGAHALGQVANFKTNSPLRLESILGGLNSLLPEDIRIKAITETDADFHARFSARNKHYRYTILNQSYLSPHLRRFSHWVKYPLDEKKIGQAAAYLVGRHNLRSFQASNKFDRNAVRIISRLQVRREDNIIQLDIEANGFVYKMVRNIVGTLIEVGRGRIEPQEIKKILLAKNRAQAGPCAPAKGLCLIKVDY